MKKFLIVLMFLSLVFLTPNSLGAVVAEAEELEDVNNPYVVYTTEGEYLFEKSDVEVLDNYISKDFKMYEIIEVNPETHTATAKFVRVLKKPEVKIDPNPSPIAAGKRQICLYLTHNDESFTPSDGYDSIYGAGGIHDVAKALKKSFQELGIDVALDETLHIPHDTSAYSRSQTTAKNLIKTYSPDAIFDIHRDGVSRKYYATEVNGKERSKIRIVVGQANPNQDENLEFATYLMAVAEEKYPWLFADIYFAKGHYNQGLYNKLLLFEMGTYLIEKELVLESVEPLAEVINTALFNTTVDTNSGEITIGGTQTDVTPTVNEHLNNLENKNNTSAIVASVVVGVVGVATVGLIVGLIVKDKKYKKSTKSAKIRKNNK